MRCAGYPISIHALLAESDTIPLESIDQLTISIHALLAESDTSHDTFTDTCPYFYPRSPCGERPVSGCSSLGRDIFLSTLSLRRATAIGRRGRAARDNFYPRSPCGERPPLADGAQAAAAISIHALLAESDILGNPCAGCPAISIHALLAESDRRNSYQNQASCYFYPRSPCGERPCKD